MARKDFEVAKISLNTHNVLDYVTGASLIAAPYLFGFSNEKRACRTFSALGWGLIGYSLMTNYKYSLAKIIPVETHMKMDLASGATLVAAPWTLGYAKRLSGLGHLAHWLFGLSAGLLVGFTRQPGEEPLKSIPEDVKESLEQDLNSHLAAPESSTAI